MKPIRQQSLKVRVWITIHPATSNSFLKLAKWFTGNFKLVLFALAVNHKFVIALSVYFELSFKSSRSQNWLF